MTSDPKEHWQTVYETKAPTDVSWYQPVPQRSLALIQSTGLPPRCSDPRRRRWGVDAG